MRRNREFCFECVECDMSYRHSEIGMQHSVGRLSMALPCGSHQNRRLVNLVTFTVVIRKTMKEYWIKGRIKRRGSPYKRWKGRDLSIRRAGESSTSVPKTVERVKRESMVIHAACSTWF